MDLCKKWYVCEKGDIIDYFIWFICLYEFDKMDFFFK